jgi:hypothetical protein
MSNSNNSAIVKPSNGGLPPQDIPKDPIRAGSIKEQNASTNKQLDLISPTKGGRRRRRKMRGGTGNSPGNSEPGPISPPIVPNTGASSESQGKTQDSYNKLAGLSGTVNEDSKYDTQKGGRRSRKTRKTRRSRRRGRKMRKTRKYMKSRKYH